MDYSGVRFPVKARDYNRIEKQNHTRVNVFGYDNGQASPIYISKEKYEMELDLLLIQEHYVLIKDFNRFMYNKTKHKERKHFCKYCLQNFTNEGILERSTKGDVGL